MSEIKIEKGGTISSTPYTEQVTTTTTPIFIFENDSASGYIGGFDPISENSAEPTYGEKLMGVSFNPSNNPEVDLIKRTCASLADLFNDAKFNSTGEKAKFYEYAIQHLMNAQMMAVKAATWSH